MTQKVGYLVFDIETIPDGRLIAATRYADENMSALAAVQRAREEARQASATGSDFLSLSLHYPVAVCVAKVGADFRLLELLCLDEPEYRTKELVRLFWKGLEHYKARLVSFNGRGFDVPVLELAAFRYGLAVPHHFAQKKEGFRYRYGDAHIDLMDFFTNHGAYRLAGGLNLLAKLLGKPGKMDIRGADVYDLYQAGQLKQINDYCMFDVLDTYFVFLRSRVLTGDLTPESEQTLLQETKDWLIRQAESRPHLRLYLENWRDEPVWP
jgi:predicted PolB exonuclease-like 3'-5' exonuclease